LDELEGALDSPDVVVNQTCCAARDGSASAPKKWRGSAALRGARAVYALQLFQLLSVHLGVGAQKVEVCAQRLPLAFLLQFLLCELMALSFVHMEHVDLHVFGPAWQVGKDRGAFTELANHVAANVTAEHGAGERILEQDLYHLFYS
jgi:hypothetical protein